MLRSLQEISYAHNLQNVQVKQCVPDSKQPITCTCSTLVQQFATKLMYITKVTMFRSLINSNNTHACTVSVAMQSYTQLSRVDLLIGWPYAEGRLSPKNASPPFCVWAIVTQIVSITNPTPCLLDESKTLNLAPLFTKTPRHRTCTCGHASQHPPHVHAHVTTHSCTRRRSGGAKDTYKV